MPRTFVRTILRRSSVESETGLSRSTIYLHIANGLFPRPVRLGPRAVGWPSDEIAALIDARVSGASDAQIKSLVSKLEAARRAA